MEYKFACQHCNGEGTAVEAAEPTDTPECRKCGEPMKRITSHHGNVSKKLDLGRRRVQKIKASKLVSLPKIWTNNNNVKEGDLIKCTLRKNGILNLRKVDAVPAGQRQKPARRVQKIKTSNFVSLPKTWLKSNDVKKGDLVEFSMNKNGILLSLRKVIDVHLIAGQPEFSNKFSISTLKETGDTCASYDLK